MKYILGFVGWILEELLAAIVLLLLITFGSFLLAAALFDQGYPVWGSLVTFIGLMGWFIAYIVNETQEKIR